MKNFWTDPYILGRDDPKERSNFRLKLEFFSLFFLKFGLAYRKVEASQGFLYQGVRTDLLFRNSPPSELQAIDVPVIDHFL